MSDWMMNAAGCRWRIGDAARLFAPMSEAHGLTGVITALRPSQEAPAVAEVQLDGRDEKLLVHVAGLRGVLHPLEVCE